MALFNKLTPGVYVEEVSGGARPISTPGTAVLAIVGFVRDTISAEDPATGQLQTKTPPTEATLVTSWPQFANSYGGRGQQVPGLYLHEAMWGFFLNGGTSAFVVGIPAKVSGLASGPPLLPRQGVVLTMGGQPTLRLTTKPLPDDADIGLEVGPPSEGDPAEAFNVVVHRRGVADQTVPNLTLATGRNVRNVVQVLTREVTELSGVEFLDSPAPLAERMPRHGPVALQKGEPPPVQAEPKFELSGKPTELLRGAAEARTGLAGLEAVDEATMVICPDLLGLHEMGMVTDKEVVDIQGFMIAHCEAMKDRIAILDCPEGKNVQAMMKWRKEDWNLTSKNGFGALYYPWLEVNTPDGSRLVPPSGHVAGIYTRTDGARGVHKAPANETVGGITGLELKVTHNEQGFLNPIGVNVIRSFPGRGILIWGARTIADAASEWRYINVRRLFSNIEEAILQSTQWTVFEPNDAILWTAIRREVSDYLTLRWREGALFGATPEEAFYVICDETINTQAVRDQGYCLIEVGIAPVKPAEFVVFTIRQKREEAAA